MPDAIERALQAALAKGSCQMGEVVVRVREDWYALRHRDDERREGLPEFSGAPAAADIARFDDAGKYRPLKTAPNLRHHWTLRVADVSELIEALEYFYPGRLAVWLASGASRLRSTSLRETLERQTGMYRVAARISDDEISDVVFRVCRSDGGCLRTILWKRDGTGAVPSPELPAAKFEVIGDQTTNRKTDVPLLCPEACALLVGECRNAVKQRESAPIGGEL